MSAPREAHLVAASEDYAGYHARHGAVQWLNRDGRLFADASRASWFMFGAGGHMVWIDPDNEAVVVARWLDGAHSTGFVRHVAQALSS